MYILAARHLRVCWRLHQETFPHLAQWETWTVVSQHHEPLTYTPQKSPLENKPRTDLSSLHLPPNWETLSRKAWAGIVSDCTNPTNLSAHSSEHFQRPFSLLVPLSRPTHSVNVFHCVLLSQFPSRIVSKEKGFCSQFRISI